MIEDDNYFKLIKLLPYTYTNFPNEMSHDKIIALAKERVVRLNEKSFAYASDDNKLLAILISKNFDIYVDNKDEYIIDDDVRELLLLSDLSDEKKLNICADVTPMGANKSEELPCLIADLLVTNKVDCTKLNQEVLALAIIRAKDSETSIMLALKCIPDWSEEITFGVFSKLPAPYNKIANYRQQAKLTNNVYNVGLANLLKEKGFVSSISVSSKHIKINTFKSSDHT